MNTNNEVVCRDAKLKEMCLFLDSERLSMHKAALSLLSSLVLVLWLGGMVLAERIPTETRQKTQGSEDPFHHESGAGGSTG